MKVIGNEPVHVPFETVRVSPVCGTPVVLLNGSEITGYAVLTGGLTVPPVTAAIQSGVVSAPECSCTGACHVPLTLVEA